MSLEIQLVCKYKAEGLPHRTIARKVYGRSSMASTVHHVLKNYYYGTSLEKEKREPKILLFDLETAPAISYHWGRWRVNVGTPQVIQRPYIITYAAKWLGSSIKMSGMLPHFEGFEDNPQDDYPLVHALWNLLDQADIVIAHYGKKFDIPQLNTRFVLHGFQPPSPYKMVCTKEMASKYFKFEGNSLNELADHLGVGNKIKTDFDLWKGCMENDPKSWDDMLDYNEMDVDVLENVYLKLRAWDKRHPNVGLYYEDSDTVKRCGCCGSIDLEKIEASAYTQVSEFETFRCGDCETIRRGRKNVRSKESMKNTIQNII